MARCGGEERSGAAEKDLVKLPFPQFLEEISAESDGTASAAGSAAVDILSNIVEYHGPAVR